MRQIHHAVLAVAALSATAVIALTGPGSTTAEAASPSVTAPTWSPSKAPLPTGTTGTFMESIACPASGSCVTVGSAQVGTSSAGGPVAESLASGSWSAVQLP